MRQKTPLIVANWKMQLTPTRSVVVARQISSGAKKVSSKIVLCPSFPALAQVQGVIGSHISLGAQDVYFETRGAYTGEVSGEMLRDIGCRYVIVGHSERRKYFYEKDIDVQKKLEAVVTAKMIPIVCVGETRAERRLGQSERVVARQLRVALAHGKRLKGQIVVAYEPVWAIGGSASNAADPKLIDAMHRCIAKECGRLLSRSMVQHLMVLYGGSVAPSNVRQYVGINKMNGALVGGASLQAKSFLDIIRACTLD